MRKMLHEALVYDPAPTEPLSLEKRTVLERVGSSRRVLEVGAHTGRFSALLRERGCHVTAIEIDPRAARIAGQAADRVIVGDIEVPAVCARIGGSFDVVLFMHVLEHLMDPWRVLRDTRHLLGPDGRVIVLLPNVACWRIRKDLFLHGRFRYTETGILDRTHLRFFTFASAHELLAGAGYELTSFAPIDVSVPLELRMSRVPAVRRFCGPWHAWMARRFPNLCSEILLLEARPSAPLLRAEVG